MLSSKKLNRRAEAQVLTLRLEFLTGRFCASSPVNRNEVEWPPHPARIYSALVAAHHDGDATAEGRAALQWLEAQHAPALHFAQLSPDELEIRDIFDNYVPVNDKALSDAATLKTAWARVFAATTDKQKAAATKKLSAAYTKAGARQASLPKSALDDLKHVLLDTRTRQARTFPTVIPRDPVVWLSWTVDAPEAHFAALEQISLTLSRVGHSSSLVATNWTSTAPPSEPTLIPTADGAESLRWVGLGQLEALEELHAREPFGEQRVMPFVPTRYALALDENDPATSSFGTEMLVFRRASGPRLPARYVESLAEAVRGALQHHATDPVPAIISGHHPDTGICGDHLAVVGLPNVGQAYANGELLGFGLALPRNSSSEDIGAVYSAIASWEKAGAELRLGRLGAWQLEREVSTPKLRTLRTWTWTQASRRWISATPVLLDRNPGPLRSGPLEKQRKAREKVRDLLCTACTRIGLPTPVSIEFSREPLLRGAAHAKSFRPPSNRRGHRPRLHVALQFEEPVEGPLLLGAGRHRGLGLFRPLPEGRGA